jgi:diadenosine tetraphosphate (Ap4A) HIT family hydrolase
MPVVTPDASLVVFETNHWCVNQRDDATLPGYLMVAAKDASAGSLVELPLPSLAELGPVLGAATALVERCLRPRRIYHARFGHEPGFTLHVHLVPVFGWLLERMSADARYRALDALHPPKRRERAQEIGAFDGVEAFLYVCREFTHGAGGEPPSGPSIVQAIADLRAAAREVPLPPGARVPGSGYYKLSCPSTEI